MRTGAMKIMLLTTALFLLAGIVMAQQETGQILGTIKDQSGAVVPGTTVTVRNKATSVERTTITGATGAFIVPSLLPATYEVSATIAGFKPAKQDVALSVGGRATANFTLVVEGVATEIVVGEVVTRVNTESQTLTDVITTKQIEQLPTMTRNPYDLVGISGNVSPGDTNRGAGYAINGQRSSSTNILLDGSDNNDTFTATAGQFVPLDSVQEFSLVTSSFTAEYGRASGGVVNVATKSGSNDFHGSVYEFNRVSKLASNGFDNNAREVPRAVFTRNQFGYSVGGPVVKNKLFFFNNTEWFRIRSSSTRVALVPTQQLIAASAQPTQDFFNAYGALKVPANGTIYTKNDIPNLCNATGPCADLPGDTPVWATVNYPVPADAGGGDPRNEYQTVARVDWNLSEKTQIYGRYALQSQDAFAGVNANSPYSGFDTGYTTFNNNMLLSVTRVFSPRIVSQSKVVYNRLNQVQPLGEAPVGPTLYLSSNATASRILGTNVALPGYLPYTPGSAIPFGGPQNLAQVFEDFSWMAGNHSFRFGGSYVYIRDNRAFGAYQEAVEQLGSNLKGGMDNFLRGQLRTFQSAVYPQGKYPGDTLTLPVGPPDFTRSNRYHDLAFYGQDSWRVSPRFTVNLGLRWEYFGVQHNKDPNKDSNFYLGSGSNIQDQFRTGSVKTVPESPIGGLWAKDRNNFSPRVGVAWDVFGNGKTSLRGGYGISYERNFGNVTFNVIQNPPNYAVIQIGAADVGGDLPVSVDNAGPLSGSTGTKVLPKVSLRAVNENLRAAYAHMWSVALEHQLGTDTQVSLQYTGSKGSGLYSIDRQNLPGSGAVYFGDEGDPLTTYANTQYAVINYRTADSFSNYNAMIAALRSRNLFNQGLQFEFNYTYAHTLDNLSSTFSEFGNNFNLGLLDPANPSLDKGNADFDIRHRIAFSGVWELPYAKNTSGVARQILDGWAVTPILTATTGTPFTVWDCTNGYYMCNRMLLEGSGPQLKGSGNPASVPDVPNQFKLIDLTSQMGGTGDNAYYNEITGTADFGPYPNNMAARNLFRGPGAWNLDIGIYKRFKLWSEQYGLQFRAEFYNLFNHANLIADGGSADISANDFVPAYRDGRRNIQFALRFTF